MAPRLTAEKKRRRENQERGERWAFEQRQLGCRVEVTLDDGELVQSTTESDPWQAADGLWVINVAGIRGAILLDRVRAL